MSTSRIVVVAAAVLCVSALARAQDPTEPITNWTAPPYWTMPAGGQVREHLTGTEASPENQGVSTESASSTSPILPFTAITPCRLVDTRQSPDTPYLDNGGSGETRTYHFDTTSYYSGTGACSLIPTAAALSLSVQFQVTDHQASLIAYPDDVTRPLVASVVAYNTGLFYMNSAVVPTGADGGINVFAQWGGQVVININGYYAPSNIVTMLNTKTGDLTLAAGDNVTITPSPHTLTISSGGAGGTLPVGAAGQTLYTDGSSWLASSVLTNDGSANVTVNGVLNLPDTTGGTSGLVKLGSSRFLHDYGINNTFLGSWAGNFTMTGADNTASGDYALTNNTDGSYNTAIGSMSLRLNTSGYSNTANGSGSLRKNTTGYYNTAVGAASLYANTTASENTAVGTGALQTQSFDNGATAFNSENTAVGFEALYSNQPTNSTSGLKNTAIGSQSLYSNTYGLYNTAAGAHSLYANTTGDRNTASGAWSLNSNTTGDFNTASGFWSLFSNTTGSGNTAIGEESLSYNTTGDDSTAVGGQSLANNTTGSDNTAVGSESLFSNSTGNHNIAIGEYAGYFIMTGNYSIDIGNWGNDESNTIRIGTAYSSGDGSGQNRTFITGIRGVTTGVADAVNVVIDSYGQLGTISSSLRFKQDVADMGDASIRLMELRPVTFHYKAHPDGPLQYGLIAEEVNEVMPELVVHDATGQIESIAYHELPALLLNELQKQRARVESLETWLAAERARNDALEARLAALETHLAAK